MFCVNCFLFLGSGALGGHRYWTGRGQAIARSPKSAYEQASSQVLRVVGEGARWCLIFNDVRVVNLVTNQVVQDCDFI